MTLTEFIYYVRRFLPLVIIGIFVFFLSFIILRLIVSRPSTTPQVVTFNTLFGKLPPIKPSHSIDFPPEISFELDNIEGRPTTATSSAKIFFIPKKNTRFGYLQNSYLMAKAIGFDTEAIKHTIENDTNVVFQDQEKKVSVDIRDFNFTYKLNYETLPFLFQATSLPDDTTIRERAKDFLRQLGKYPSEFSTGREHIIYLHYNSATNDLDVVESKQNANVVEVDFFRPDIDGFPIVSPKYFNAHNYVVMVFKGNESRVIKSQISFFEKDDMSFGIYPIKTGDQAWADLQAKKAFITSPGGNKYPITIRQMFLAYYDPDVYQEYLQPVYVFLGDNNFAAYVPAVSDEYIQK